MTKKNEVPLPGVRVRLTEEAAPSPLLKTRWAWLTGTFFGAGLLKPGPGTWGSLAALALWYALAAGVHLSGDGIAVASVLGAAIAAAVGIPAATIVARESGLQDPGYVVVDEVAGQWLTLAAATVDVGHALLAFALFRFFDIVKPWPVRSLERLPDGTGIMLDDLAAGIYGLVALLVVRIWW